MWIVTGASGFVGRHVISALGDGARALARHDWKDDATLRKAVAGAEGIVHSASVVHRPDTPIEEYVRFNVDGTAALLEAARAGGVRRFVFVSSIKVHGESPAGIIDEHTPVRPDQHYSRTKAEAERLVLAAEDLRPVVLRLCPVYGRGDKGNVRTMIRSIARRRFLVPGTGAARKSIVHVSTVGEVARAAAFGRATGVFVVADRETPTIRELADAIARQLGRRRPFGIPAPLLRAAASTVSMMARVARRPTVVSAQLIEKAMANSLCDPSRVERELGVTCHVDLEEALADEIAWLRGLGAI